MSEVTEALRAFEDSLDHTISLGGAVLSQLSQSRKEMGLSAVFGQGVFDDAGDVLGGLLEARRAAVKTHRGCEAAGRYLRVTLGPPNENKGPPPMQLPMDMSAEADEVAKRARPARLIVAN